MNDGPAATSERPVSAVGALVRHPRHGPLPVLLLVLTLATGAVDALSILGLGRVFVANMTGNVVFVAFALAGAAGFSLWGSVLALAGFLVGAALAGELMLPGAPPRGQLLRNVVLLEFGLTVVSLLLATAAAGEPGDRAKAVIAFLAALGLGMQNAVVRYLAVPDLTTTVLTMTITGLGTDLRRHDRIAVTRRLLAVVAMFVGALIGSVVFLSFGLTAALALIAAVFLFLGAFIAVIIRSPTSWQGHPS